jgi:hypothetical protein
VPVEQAGAVLEYNFAFFDASHSSSSALLGLARLYNATMHSGANGGRNASLFVRRKSLMEARLGWAASSRAGSACDSFWFLAWPGADGFGGCGIGWAASGRAGSASDLFWFLAWPGVDGFGGCGIGWAASSRAGSASDLGGGTWSGADGFGRFPGESHPGSPFGGQA